MEDQFEVHEIVDSIVGQAVTDWTQPELTDILVKLLWLFKESIKKSISSKREATNNSL